MVSWGCKDQKPQHAPQGQTVIAPGEPADFISEVTPYIDTIIVVPLETTPQSLVGWVSKMLLLPNGNVVLSTSSNILVFDAEGHYLFTVGSQGRGPEEYAGATDLCLSQDGKTIDLLVFPKEVMSYSATDGTYVRKVSLQSPIEHIDFDAIASGADGSFFVFAAQQGIATRENKNPTLFHFGKDGRLLLSALPAEENMYNIDLITQTWDNQYVLRPQSTDQICYYLSDSLPVPRVRIDFGARAVPAAYSPELETYLRSDYYKLPIYIHETADQLLFTFCGPGAWEHYCLHSFADNRTLTWKRTGDDPNNMLRIIGSDREFFYGIYNDYRSPEEIPLAEMDLLKRAVIRRTAISLTEDSNPALVKIRFRMQAD